MARQYRIKRQIASIPLTAGMTMHTIDIPRDYDLECIGVRIVGGLQVTAGATSVRAEAPTQLIPRMELTSDGKNTIYSAPFWKASLGNYGRKLNAANARVITPPSGVAIATYQVEALGFIDLASFDFVRPKDSNLRTGGMSLFQLRFQFGAPGDCFVGGTVAFSNMVVEVFAINLVELPDAAGEVTGPIALKKVSFQEVNITSTNANLEIKLPAGNLIESVLVRTEGQTTAGEPSTGNLNGVTLQAGVDVRHKLSAGQIRACNNADYGAVVAGHYIADVTGKGGAPKSLSELWDVSGAAEPKALLDVTGYANGKAQIIITEYVMVAG